MIGSEEMGTVFEVSNFVAVGNRMEGTYAAFIDRW